MQTHVKKIYNFEVINNESASRSRQFINKLVGHIRALEYINNSNGPVEQRNMILAFSINAHSTHVPEYDQVILKKIDILLDGNHFFKLLGSQIIKIFADGPVMPETKFDLIILEPIPKTSKNNEVPQRDNFNV